MKPDINIAIGIFSILCPTKLLRLFTDRGGTFCDVIASSDGRNSLIFKLLSVDPQNYRDAPTEAIRRVLETFEGCTIPRGELLDGSRIGMFSGPRRSALPC